MSKGKIAAVAVMAAAAMAVPAAAAASPAHHREQLTVVVTWRHHGATEVVTVRRDPRHEKVQAVGNCASTGLIAPGSAPVSKPGRASRAWCPHGWWVSVGYWVNYRGDHWSYHAVRGSRNLYG
jgi:hypothetical protein